MDKFYLHKIFPEPDKIFSFDYKSYNETKENCLFVIDTNILFVPFQTSKKGLSDIKRIFERLKSNERLYIPARVVREFAKNRGENLATIYRKAEEANDRLNKINIDLGSFPILSENENYRIAKEIEKEIVGKIDNLRDNLKNLKEDIKKWNWDDPVSELYRTIFTNEIIVETQKPNEEIEKDLEFRIEHQIAPGFKDSNKIDKGIGDLIIWQTILEIGKSKNNHITFVSNEKKSDWFHSEYRTSLYPKFELFDEFRRITDGFSINIINFEEFLISQDATEDTIIEIRELYAPSGFKIIDKETFITVLKDCLLKAQSKNGFVSSKYLIETVMADLDYDIGSSWELFNKLEKDGIIESYRHYDPNGVYPPISAVRLKTEKN